jgi:hypothetical protein
MGGFYTRDLRSPAKASDALERLLEAAVDRVETQEDALEVALQRLADGWGFDGALGAVRGRHGVTAAAEVERTLTEAALAAYDRRLRAA